MYGSILQDALVDQAPTPLKVDLSVENGTNIVIMTLPHFWVNAVVDPGMTVLRIF